MNLTPANHNVPARSKTEIAERTVIYGIFALFLCLSLPWEFLPFPLSQLSFISTGAGDFFESRLFLHLGILTLTYLWIFTGYLRGRTRFFKTTLDIPLLLFLLVALFSIFRLTDLHSNLDGLLLVASYIMFFYLVLNNLRSLQDVRLFLYIMVFAGAVLSFYGIYQYLVGFKELARYVASMSLSVDTPSRVFAIFISPNHLAGFLNMLVPIAFVLTLNEKSSWKKIGALTALIIMIDCIFLTYSRGGLVSLGLVVSVLLIYYFMRKQTEVVMNLFAAAILAAITSFLIVRMGTILSPTSPAYTALSASQSALSMQGRFLLWRGASRIIATYPLRGIGLGSFASVYPFFQYGGLYSKHAHNVYLEIFAETGIFGICLFVTVFVLVLKNATRLARQKQSLISDFGIAFFASSLGFMFHALVDFEWSMATAGVLFWGIAGLIFCCKRLQSEKDRESSNLSGLREEKPMSLPVLLIVSTGSLVLLLVLSSVGYAQYLSNQATTQRDKQKIAFSRALLERASKFDPINPSVKHDLARIYLDEALNAKSVKSKDLLLSQARREAKHAANLRPYWAQYYAQIGIVYAYERNRKEATAYLEKAETLYPKNPLFRVLTGEFYYSQGDYKKAEIGFKEALSLRKYYLIWYPKNAEDSFERAHVGLGLTYKEIGQPIKAQQEFKKALRLNPENAIAKKELKNAETGR